MNFNDKCYIFCVNFPGLILGSYLSDKGVTVEYLDNDKDKWNKTILGYRCIQPEKADKEVQCFIATERENHKIAIAKQLEKLGFSQIDYIDEEWKKKWVLNSAPQLDDELFVRIMWYCRMGYEIDLSNPITFNEKLQWLKLYDKNPQYTMMADKYSVKEWVGNCIGKQYVIPTYGVYETYSDIDFESLPNCFVMKATHDSGSTVICEDKSGFDYDGVKAKFDTFLSRNKFYAEREFSYRNIKPRIIVEKYLGQSQDKITDYKLMCFDGKCQLCFTCTERNSADGLKVTFFDLDWNRLPFIRQYPSSEKEIPKPKRWKDMIILAEKLSSHIPFVRVDFYEIGNEIYFGEMTFYPGSGYEKFTPFEWDRKIGELIKII